MRETLNIIPGPLRRFLLFTAILLVCDILLTKGAYILTAFLDADNDGFAYTPRHFSSPEFPLYIHRMPESVHDYFGMWAVVGVMALIIYYGYMVGRMASESEEWGKSQFPPSKETILPLLTRWQRRGACIVLGIIVITATIGKMILTIPLVSGPSAPSKQSLFVGFLVNFNRGIAQKARFDEAAYEKSMFTALKFDGKEYRRFANSRYWAYYTPDEAPRWTMREVYSAKELHSMFEQGKLGERDIYEGAILNLKAGERDKALEMLTYLLKEYPQNKKYADLYGQAGFENK